MIRAETNFATLEADRYGRVFPLAIMSKVGSFWGILLKSAGTSLQGIEAEFGLVPTVISIDFDQIYHLKPFSTYKVELELTTGERSLFFVAKFKADGQTAVRVKTVFTLVRASDFHSVMLPQALLDKIG
ncbi:MAG: hypothetical protein WAX85_00130 [Minisyncoccia bacterium]